MMANPRVEKQTVTCVTDGPWHPTCLKNTFRRYTTDGPKSQRAASESSEIVKMAQWFQDVGRLKKYASAYMWATGHCPQHGSFGTYSGTSSCSAM